MAAVTTAADEAAEAKANLAVADEAVTEAITNLAVADDAEEAAVMAEAAAEAAEQFYFSPAFLTVPLQQEDRPSGWMGDFVVATERGAVPLDGLQYWLWQRRPPPPTTTRLPLILYLHGASGRGADWRHLESGLPRLLMTEDGEPSLLAGENCIVVAPQCPTGTEWAKPKMCEALMALLAHIEETRGVQASRRYVTGMSMGGLGCWQLCARNPKVFAAALPICGGGEPVFAPLLSHLPILFAHAEDDKVVPFSASQRLVDALKQAGSTVAELKRWRSAPGAENESWCQGHNCWDACFRDGEVWTWLFRQEAADAVAI